MKEVLIYAAIGYAALQTLLILAVCAAAARPTPTFEAPEKKAAKPAEREEELELELV